MLEKMRNAVGPMFMRELVELGRKRRGYILRFGVGVVMLYLVFQVYAEPGAKNNTGISAMSQLGGRITYSISMAQILACFLGMPLLTLGAISRERRNGTLDLLLASPLTNREILFGKLASHLLFVVQMLGASVPVYALFALWGGVSFQVILFTAVACLAALIIGGLVGLAQSARQGSVFGKLFLVYFWTMIVWLIIFFFSLPVFYAAASTLLGGMREPVIAFLIGLTLFSGVVWLASAAFYTFTADRLRSQLQPIEPLDFGHGPLPRLIHRFLSNPRERASFVTFLAVTATLLFDELWRIGSREGGLADLTPVLAIVTLLAVGVLASRNRLLANRPGPFDILLTTPLLPRELLAAAFHCDRSSMLRIFAVLGAIVLRETLDNPTAFVLGLWLTTLLAVSLFIVLAAYAGTLASNTASFTVWLAFVPILAAGALPVPIQTTEPLLVWATMAAFLAVSFLLPDHRPSPLRIGFQLVAIYASTVSTLTLLPDTLLDFGATGNQWMGKWSIVWLAKEDNPWLVLSPFFWLTTMIERADSISVESCLFVARYILAVGLSTALGIYLLTRQFDRLVGRPIGPAAKSALTYSVSREALPACIATDG